MRGRPWCSCRQTKLRRAIVNPKAHAPVLEVRKIQIHGPRCLYDEKYDKEQGNPAHQSVWEQCFPCYRLRANPVAVQKERLAQFSAHLWCDVDYLFADTCAGSDPRGCR